MAYRLNRRCGPGSGIRHTLRLAPITPKWTHEERLAEVREKWRRRRKHIRQRAKRKRAAQRNAARAFHAMQLAANKAPGIYRLSDPRLAGAAVPASKRGERP